MTLVRCTFPNSRESANYFLVAALKNAVGQKVSLSTRPGDWESTLGRFTIVEAEQEGDHGVFVVDLPDGIAEQYGERFAQVGFGYEMVEGTRVPTGQIVGKARVYDLYPAPVVGVLPAAPQVEVPVEPEVAQYGVLQDDGSLKPAPSITRLMDVLSHDREGAADDVEPTATVGPPPQPSVLHRVVVRRNALLGIEGVPGEHEVTLLCWSNGDVSWERA